MQAQRAPGGARVADQNRRQMLQECGDLQRRMDGRGGGEWRQEDGGQEGGRGREIGGATIVAQRSSPGPQLSSALAAKLDYIHRWGLVEDWKAGSLEMRLGSAQDSGLVWVE